MKPIKHLFEILKGFGIKTYLLILLTIVLCLGLIFAAYYLTGRLFEVNETFGVVMAIVITVLLITIQFIIVKKTYRDK